MPPLKPKNPNNNLNQNNPANPNKSPFSHPQDTRLFFGGADTDISREILGTEKEGGKYIDATNMRVDDFTSGNIGGGIGKGVKRIKGEEVLYTNNQNPYICIGSFNVGNTIVEFWAPENPADGGIITVDGQVMCKSVNFALTQDHPLQGDTNDTALGGEVYITDFNLEPMYFSIKDLVLNYNNGVPTTKYFADFNIANYVINFVFPTDNIVYDDKPLNFIGSGGGLPVGQYAYAYSFIDSTGNQTNWSVQTPLIYVPQNLEAVNSQSPWINLKTIGNDPNQATPTSYGVSMRFRVNNFNNYSFVQIMRIPYNGGQAIGYSPTPLIVKTIPVISGIQIVTYVDCVNNQDQTIVNATLSSYQLLSQIARAKAIRYFYNKILLGNIEYLDRDISNGITFLNSANNNAIVPILKSLGPSGYKDPINHAYRRGYMHGEQYGYYLVAWDSNYSRSLAIPIKNNGTLGVQMPNKRDPLATTYGGDSLTYSPNYSWQASTRGQVEKTFEVVDYKLGIRRPNNGGGSQQNGNADQSNKQGCNILNSKASGATRKGSSVPAQDVGYRPFYPVNPADTNESNVWYTPVDSVAGDDCNATHLHGINFDPTIFNPNINALGVSLIGLNTWPDWVTAFSVVRTEKAGKIVAQGMGFWQMQDTNTWVNAGQKGTGKKSQTKLAVHFPDVENGVVSSAVMDDIKNNPTNYQIQIVEPLGFSSEVFHARSNTSNNTVIDALAIPGFHADCQVDMVVHAKCQCELINDTGASSGVTGTVRVNEGEDASQIGIQDGAQSDSWYVGFGVWRNQGSQPNIGGGPFSQNGNHLFGIKSVAIFFGPADQNQTATIPNEEGVQNYVFELVNADGSPVSLYTQTGGNYNTAQSFDDSGTRNFTEPVYIINIVRVGTSIQDLNFASLLPTGNFVKITANIGFYSGAGNTFQLCGERTVDCGKLPTDTVPGTTDRYIWIEPAGDVTVFRWINVSYVSAPNLVLIKADILNGTTIYNGLRLYGIYTCDITTNFDVVFSDSNYLPPIGASILVKYDNRFPVEVYGGDTFVGQSCFPLVHRSNKTDNGNGDINGFGTQFRWNRAMPYLWYNLKENYYIIRNTPASLLPTVQDGEGALGVKHPLLYGSNSVGVGAIRQMLILYFCQSYTHTPLSYEACYPLVNYIMRPQEWNSGKDELGNLIFSQYATDYPGEIKRWQMGGFRFQQFSNPLILNLDYSKENVDDPYDFVSQNFYSKNTYFPNRVAWSDTRPIETVLAPNLKTFVPTNVFDTSDNRGQIQKLHSFRHRLYGENAYALCELDFCTLICNKSLITSAAGDFLTATKPSFGAAFIQEQVWVNELKKAGLPDNFWMTFADNGQEAWYANYNGVFNMTEKGYGTTIEPITEGYYYQLYKSICQRVQKSGQTSLVQSLGGMYNTKQKEYWLYFNTSIPTYLLTQSNQYTIPISQVAHATSTPHYNIVKASPNASVQLSAPNEYTQILIKIFDTTGEGINIFGATGVLLVTAQADQWIVITYNPYSVTGNGWSYKLVDKDLNEYKDTFVFAYSNDEKSKKWLGVFDYQFDKLLSFNGQIYGSRYSAGQISTWNLDTGYRINDAVINGRVYQVFNPQLQQSYIYSRFRINSNIKPENIKIYRPDDISVNLGVVTSAQMKDYDAFENLLTRLSDTNVKPEGTNLVVQVQTLNPDEEFFLNSISFEYNKVR